MPMELGMKLLQQGIKAPDFSLPDQDGKFHSLSEYQGKKVVLYFYPKNDTPGCTKESCDFRDDHKKFQEKNAVIIGISHDNEDSHQAFIKKFNLPFTLLCDKEKIVSWKYGVLDLQEFEGKEYLGIHRTTYLIDEEGKIMKVFGMVNVEGHSKEILSLI